MGNWGQVDYKQLLKLQKNLDKLNQMDAEAFINKLSKELAARLLGKVIRRTPVGKYPKGSGKNGGTLRRGWTSQTEKEAMNGGKVPTQVYVQSLSVQKNGNIYHIEIVNPVLYASYVEFGHRTRDHKGWVKGTFMLTQSEIELDAQTPGIVEKKLKDWLGGMFDD